MLLGMYESGGRYPVNPARAGSGKRKHSGQGCWLCIPSCSPVPRRVWPGGRVALDAMAQPGKIGSVRGLAQAFTKAASSASMFEEIFCGQDDHPGPKGERTPVGHPTPAEFGSRGKQGDSTPPSYAAAFIGRHWRGPRRLRKAMRRAVFHSDGFREVGRMSVAGVKALVPGTEAKP